MRSRSTQPLLLLLVSLALALASQAAHAMAAEAPSYDPHHVDGSGLGGIIDLSQRWLVYGGDNPRFADPTFDDSQWQAVSMSQRLDKYGIHNQPIVWYRIHVQIPPSAKDLSLDINRFRGSMQAYINGVLVGQLGAMEAGGDLRQNRFHYVVGIPQSALNNGTIVIAVRAAIGRVSEKETRVGGPDEVFLGKSNLLHDKAALFLFSDLSSNVIRLLLQSVILFVLVALVIALPRQREYLALAISFIFAAADNAFYLLLGTRVELIPLTPTQNLIKAFLALFGFLAFLEFVNLVLKKEIVRGIRTVQTFLIISTLFQVIRLVATLDRQIVLSPALSSTLIALQVGFSLPYVFVTPALVIWCWRKRRNSDAGLLFIPALLDVGTYGYFIIGSFLIQRHVIRSFPNTVSISALSVSWIEVSDVTVSLVLLYYIILRVVRTVREGARYASEVEAAQTVQKLLLARSRQATPGFKVDTVYLPASEVGGDFFLVSPHADGSLVAIVGDVAGKGMLAAMRVSVILGILRREDSRTPGIVLAHLNDAMIRQGDMGLTTSCCVHIQRDGRYSVANAGHISPFIAGREVPTSGALPLGVAPDQDYEETQGHLQNGEALILISDGVVEARSPSKELLGFERLADLTKLPAEEIANTAKLFGQEDDITVLSLACLP